ncbi:MAG: hypothetical protein HY609_07115 [Deltaproteobacteria bacterium]|nr:hypothetical protein [Deltaproteobacteria bacterium]MBI4224690.1 hypothetical protein [Deltaproteobacteria bacterium]
MFNKKLIFLILVLGLALTYAWSRIHVIELGYAVTQLGKEAEQLTRDNGLLKTRLADALATAKLAALAKKHKMSPPDQTRIFFISEETQ